MEIKEIRKFLLDNYKCVKDFPNRDFIDIEKLLKEFENANH